MDKGVRMALDAPLSKRKRNSFLIYAVACVAGALWFGYDGYLNQEFIKKHTDEQGKPNGTLIVNQKAPPVLVGCAVLFGVYVYAIRNRKVMAGENELVMAGRERIPYDAIDRIDKTYFEKKGFFTIVYKKADGREVHRKLNDRDYDNLGPLLDHLIAKIT
jgi:hypothetical protein